MPFKLRRAMQYKSDDGMTAIVEYDGSPTPDVTVTIGDVQLENVEHQPGRVMVRGLQDNFDDKYPKFIFRLPRAYYLLQLCLKFRDSDHIAEDVPDMDILVSDADLTGQDVTLDVSFQYDSVGRSNHAVTTIVTNPAQFSPDPMVPLYSLAQNSSDSPVDLVSSRSTETEDSYTLRVRPGENHREGVILFRTYAFLFDRLEDSDILMQLDVERMVPFYRADHEGPYPSDFVAFVNKTYHTRQIGRAEVERGTVYTLMCPAFGERLQSVSVARVQPNGDFNILVTTERTSAIGFILSADYMFWKVKQSDEGLYQRIARTDSTVITRNIDLVVV
ncbi:hypothetical protein BaRGS_00022355 [Batillaria attramentaria]|uniref:Uncharacterized protein n=1 Tax=Batillaria attramentaria TaxID=370345 RepID=A0ABD0KGY4_9CAEN